MFYKMGSTPILGVYQSSGKFSKCASKNNDITTATDDTIKKAINLISKDVLKAVSNVYNISDNIDDYIFPIPRAVTANIPNNNGDMFPHEELIRFSPSYKCQVYKTFRNTPLHVEHAADNPKTARGFLPDSYYMQQNPNDMYVLTIVAMDTTKDAPLAEGLMSGEINKFSMGCICEAVQCSVCNKIAKNDNEMCNHLKYYKLSKINGELVYEKCLGVGYRELSVVGDPADIRATTQMMLQKAAKRKQELSKQKSNIISSLVSKQDQVEVARYFKDNINKMPPAMLNLALKIL